MFIHYFLFLYWKVGKGKYASRLFYFFNEIMKFPLMSYWEDILLKHRIYQYQHEDLYFYQNMLYHFTCTVFYVAYHPSMDF